MSYSNLLPVVGVTALTVLETTVGLPVLPDAMDMAKRNSETVGKSLEVAFERTQDQRQTIVQQPESRFSDVLTRELGSFRASGGSASTAAQVAAADQTVQAEALPQDTTAPPETQPPGEAVSAANAQLVAESPRSQPRTLSRDSSRSSSSSRSILSPPVTFSRLAEADLSSVTPMFEDRSPATQSPVNRPSPLRTAASGASSDVPAVSLPAPLFLMLGAIACLALTRIRRAAR